jgi:hypothetical protein
MANKPQEKEILELIQWIDSNERKLIKVFDELGGMGRSLGFVFGILYFVSQVVNLVLSDFATKIALQVAIVTAIIAYVSVVFQISERRMFEIRLNRALKLKTFSDKEKPLLKALLQIKSNNEEVKLMLLYEMNKEAHGDIFTKRKLLESICK